MDGGGGGREGSLNPNLGMLPLILTVLNRELQVSGPSELEWLFWGSYGVFIEGRKGILLVIIPTPPPPYYGVSEI